MNISNEELTKTFDLMFGQLPMIDEEEAAAVEWDAEQAAQSVEVQDAYNRFVAGTSDLADALKLEKAGLVVAIYGASDDERPVGFRLRKIDGNEYSDQAGIEENFRDVTNAE